MHNSDDGEQEDLWPTSTKIELLKMVMTGEIPRKDYLNAIKDKE